MNDEPKGVIRRAPPAGRFAITPEWLLRALAEQDASRASRAVHLFDVLSCFYANRSGVAYPGRQRLAADLRVSVDTVNRALRALRLTGAVEVRERRTAAGDRTSNGYILHPSPPQPGGHGGRS